MTWCAYCGLPLQRYSASRLAVTCQGHRELPSCDPAYLAALRLREDELLGVAAPESAETRGRS